MADGQDEHDEQPGSEAAGEQRSAFEVVAMVSHELRSPLTSIKGFTSLLLNRWDRISDEQKRELLAQVHHDADRVARLVGELLDVSRMETGRLALHRRPADLGEVAAAVVDRVRMAFPALEATVEAAPGLPQPLVDPDRVEQVLTNLVENAAKYGKAKGVVVAIGRRDDHVAVSVHDEGPGIPPEDLPRLFDRFFHRETGRPTGTGLGLWLSRGLVEAHGGRLEVESAPGRGTTFCFTLPVRGGAPDQE